MNTSPSDVPSGTVARGFDAAARMDVECTRRKRDVVAVPREGCLQRSEGLELELVVTAPRWCHEGVAALAFDEVDKGGHQLVELNVDSALLQDGELVAAMRQGVVQLVKRTGLA